MHSLSTCVFVYSKLIFFITSSHPDLVLYSAVYCGTTWYNLSESDITYGSKLSAKWNEELDLAPIFRDRTLLVFHSKPRMDFPKKVTMRFLLSANLMSVIVPSKCRTVALHCCGQFNSRHNDSTDVNRHRDTSEQRPNLPLS